MALRLIQIFLVFLNVLFCLILPAAGIEVTLDQKLQVNFGKYKEAKKFLLENHSRGIITKRDDLEAVLYEKRFGLSHHPVISNLGQYGAGLIFIFPIAYSIETMQVQWTGTLVATLAYLVIGNSVLAMTLLLAMIRAGEVSRVSALLFLVPPLAAIFGWLLLGEIMPPVAWLGMALAGIGVIIATRKKD